MAKFASARQQRHMPLPLSELFPDRDYRFHLTLRKGDVAEFFAARDPVVLAERRRWFAEDPARYLVADPAAGPLVAEAEELLGTRIAGELPARLAHLGAHAEPDLVLMLPDAAGDFRLRAGAVCFPTSWALEEKFGLTLDAIHDVVPGLNPALGRTINQFLQKLRPGVPFVRANWGLAATPELNLHPALARPRLTSPLDPAHTWLRVEDQILAALPATGGILFGIQIQLVPLTQLLADPELRLGFHRALVTMPDDLAAYKGLAPIREGLVELAQN